MKASTYRRYLVVLLGTIYAFNLIDRWGLSLALQNIKRDLHLSDTMLGLLTGLAFAFFYSTLGVPIGRWADRGNRVTIVSVTTGLWSIMVILSGRAASFVQLLLIRIGVAVGEAGCLPPAYSLISEYFSRAERPQALGLYFLGVPLSYLLGFFFAGWLNQLYGWRTMFALIGIPGLVLAAVARTTMKEPRLEHPNVNGEVNVLATRWGEGPRSSGAAPPLRVIFRILFSSTTYRNLLLTIAVNYFFSYGILQWQPAFFIRSYGLQTGLLGTWLALISSAAATVGTLSGGYLASRWAANNERLQLRVMAALNSISGMVSVFVYLSRDYHQAFALAGVALLAINLGNGPAFAVMQAVVPLRVRAISISIVFLFANLIGMGLGPLTVGVVSDSLRPTLGVESLRYALAAASPGFLWGAWHLWRASKSVSADIEVAEVDDGTGLNGATLRVVMTNDS